MTEKPPAEAVAAQVTPAKPKKKKPAAAAAAAAAAAGGQRKRDGPSLSKMIVAAIIEDGNRKGTSVGAIKKYLSRQGVDTTAANRRINKMIVKLVTDGILCQVTGSGASGSFKVNKVPTKKPATVQVKKIAKPKAVKVKKPATKTKKPASAAKKTPVKKVTTKKVAAKSPAKKKVAKKAAAKPTPKKAKPVPKKAAKKTTPKKPVAKKAKSAGRKAKK